MPTKKSRTKPPILSARERHAQQGRGSDKAQHPGLTRANIILRGVVRDLPRVPAQTGYASDDAAQRAAIISMIEGVAPGAQVHVSGVGILDVACMVLASDEQLAALRRRFGDENVSDYWADYGRGR